MTELRERLIALASGREAEGLRTATVARRDPPRIAFLFTGQGAQYAGMTRGLYEHAPVFRAALDRCAALLEPYLARPLLDVLFPAEGTSTLVNETAYTQPALFAIEYALAELWRSWGVVPDVVLGHSVGEYAAACVAGVMSLEDALRLVARRGALMQSLPAGGAMAAIFAREDQVARRDRCRTPPTWRSRRSTGRCRRSYREPSDAVEAVCRRFADEGVRCQPLTVSHAFHSPLVDPILDAFEREAETVRFAPPRLSLISNLTGALVRSDDVVRASYWRRHVREAVRFNDSVISLSALRPDCVVEVGPHPTLLSFMGATLGDGAPQLIGSVHKNRDDWAQMLGAWASLFLAGANVDWRGVDAQRTHCVVDLPSYPFQRERCWFQSRGSHRVATTIGRPSGHPLLGARLRTSASEAIYESQIHADAPGFAREHRVLDHVILPATAFLDTLVAAAQQLHGRDAVAVENVTLPAALVLEEDGAPRTMQTVCGAPRDGFATAAISSAPAEGTDGDTWVTHVTATLRAEATRPLGDITLQDARARCAHTITPQEFYESFERKGLQFGHGFRSIRRLWRGDAQALAEVELPADFVVEAPAYRAHPVLLDGCVQAIAAALPDTGGDALFLPIGIDRYTLFRHPGAKCWSYAVVSGGDGAALRADIHVFDADGEAIGELRGVLLKRVGRDAFDVPGERWLDACLYETQWPAVPLAPAKSPAWSTSELAQAGARAVQALRAAASFDEYDAFHPKFEAVCADYVVQTMRTLGWSPSAGESIDGRDLARRLGVVSRHTRLFERLLAILGEVGILAREPRGWRVRHATARSSSGADAGAPQEHVPARCRS